MGVGQQRKAHLILGSSEGTFAWLVEPWSGVGIANCVSEGGGMPVACSLGLTLPAPSFTLLTPGGLVLCCLEFVTGLPGPQACQA